jgi:hypothetical protein
MHLSKLNSERAFANQAENVSTFSVKILDLQNGDKPFCESP